MDNRKSLADLRANLTHNRINPDSVPLVLQYNKQDLTDLLTANELSADLNTREALCFRSIAIRGQGVLETLAAIITQTIRAAIDANGDRMNRLKNQDLDQAVETIFAPFYERVKQLSGEVKPVSSRYREIRVSSRGIDESVGSEGPIRGDLVLEPVDLLSRSVQSSLVMAEKTSEALEVEEKLGKMRGDLAVLAEISSGAGGQADFDQVLGKAMDLAIENLGVDCGSLLLVKDNSKALGEKILKGLEHDPLNATEIKGLGSLAYLLTQRKEAVLTNNIADYLQSSHTSMELKGFCGLASYPLLARNLTLGLINLYTIQPGRRFGDDEKLFLAILSNFLSLYILNSFYALKQKG
jgi:hypothetical protein